MDREEISWITPRLGVSGYDALYEGYDGRELRKFSGNYVFGQSPLLKNVYIINTAGEINGKEDIKIPVEPSMGAEHTLARVDMIADVINEMINGYENLSSDYRVVVHCAMGMERSVLATAWYLQKYQNYTLDSAYQKIREVRPIAQDRASWIGKELETSIKEFDWNTRVEEDLEPVRYTV